MEKKKVGIIASAVATCAVCASLIAGSTYALFTSEDEVNIAITSGKVDVTATIDTDKIVKNLYAGDAVFDGNTLTVSNIFPKDSVEFDIVVTNDSSCEISYRTVIYLTEDDGLLDGLEVTIDGVEGNYTGSVVYSNWYKASDKFTDTIHVTLALPEGAGNEYQDKTCKISYTVEAIQGNVSTTNAVCSVTSSDGTLTEYSDFATAVAALKENDTLDILRAGSYGDINIGAANVTVNGIIGTDKAHSTVFDKIGTTATGVTFNNMYCGYSESNVMDNVTYNNCTFVGDGTGTALYIHVANLSITNCTFKNWNSALYTCGDNHAAQNIILDGNTFENVNSPFDGYWGCEYDAEKTDGDYNIRFTNNTIINSNGKSYVQIWDYTQWLNSSNTDRDGSAVRALVSGNTGNFDLYLTHFDWLYETTANCDFQLVNGQNIVYRSYLEVNLSEKAEANRADFVVLNADGSELTTYNAMSNISKAYGSGKGVYAICSGDYQLVNKTTGDVYYFTVTDPVLNSTQSYTAVDYTVDEDIWYVYNVNGLLAFADDVNHATKGYTKTVKLMNDIDFADAPAWTPLGISGNDTAWQLWLGKGINVTIDGQGHKISNMTIDGNDTYAIGFIGTTFGDWEIKNLTFENAEVINVYDKQAAVVVGLDYSNVVMNDVHVINCTIVDVTPNPDTNAKNRGWGVAGLVGSVASNEDSKIELVNCSVEGGTYSAIDRVCGLIGNINGAVTDGVTVTDCKVIGVTFNCNDNYDATNKSYNDDVAYILTGAENGSTALDATVENCIRNYN